MSDALVVENVGRSFSDGQGKLSEVSFRVADAEFVAILGPSGSGKSALLAICGGLEPVDSGRILIAGHDISTLGAAAREAFLQRHVGWVLPEAGLLPILTATENVVLAVRSAGRPEGEARRTAELALEAMGLGHRSDRYASELSAGEQRIVALARALAKAPALLIADEPTVQLDSRSARRILDLIREASASGTAVLLATHDAAVARMAARALRLEGGTVRGSSPPGTWSGAAR